MLTALLAALRRTLGLMLGGARSAIDETDAMNETDETRTPSERWHAVVPSCFATIALAQRR